MVLNINYKERESLCYDLRLKTPVFLLSGVRHGMNINEKWFYFDKRIP